MVSPYVRQVFILTWSTLSGAGFVVGLHGTLRAALMLVFVGLCPGLAAVGLLRLKSAVIEISFGIVASLALDAIFAALFLYLGAWSPGRIFAVLLMLALALSVLDLVVTSRQQRVDRHA